VTLRPFDELRVAPSTVEGRQAQGHPERSRGVTIVAALAVGWVAVLLLAPWLAVPAASAVYLFGAHICHQIAERSWHLGGAQLPVCARCLGIYVGAAVALMPGPWRVQSRAPRDPAYVRRVAILAVALNAATMAIEWAGLAQMSNAVRTGAGAALGIAVALAIRQALHAPALRAGTLEPVQ